MPININKAATQITINIPRGKPNMASGSTVVVKVVFGIMVTLGEIKMFDFVISVVVVVDVVSVVVVVVVASSH